MVFVFNRQWFSIIMSLRWGHSLKSHDRLVEPILLQEHPKGQPGGLVELNGKWF